MSGAQPDPLQQALLARAQARPPPAGKVSAPGWPATQLHDPFFDTFQLEHSTTDFSYYLRLAINAATLMFAEALALLLALLLGGLIRYALRGAFLMADIGELLLPAWWLGAIALRLTPGWGVSAVEEIRRMTLLALAVTAFMSFALFVTHTTDAASRIAMLSTCALTMPLVGVARGVAKATLIRRHRWGIPVVLYGWGTILEHVATVLRQESGLGYRPVGVFNDAAPRGTRIAGLPVLGPMQESTPRAPCAILAAADFPREQIGRLIEGPLAAYRNVIIVPDLLDAPSLWVRPREFIGVIGLEISNNLLKPTDRILKRTLELLLVLLLAPLWLPLLAVLAFLVWAEDRGSPFYAQERIGYQGRRIRAFKLRSMVRNAEDVLRHRLAEDAQLRAEWETHCKLKNDPRITWIGRLLRRTSLDELPQLFNVLAGDMALVGPRPLPPYHEEKLPPRIREIRHRVRPGITGLWQVSGRSDAGNAGLERWDLYYVRNWSVWLDAVVLVRTFRAVFKAEGAY
ncbi:MAG: exopolysaccharide biosynthesis polyprenyl glycosylphosphotransferase [Verrucomicrobia bacterium]|nr:MAG: exopolysaccharide biosynthesis polyprenyl glycosylphosphotransferase [Verrucomicrobiota bacterium]